MRRQTMRVTFAEIPDLLEGFARDQVPFATAVTITRTAADAVAELKRGIGQRFKVRNHRTLSTVVVIPARKRDWPNLRGGIGIRDEWMAKHEEGGTKKPERAGRFAVPYRIIDSRRTGTGSIQQTMRPRRLTGGNKPRAVLVEDTILSTSNRGSLRKGFKLFLLRPTIKLKPRLEGRETLDDITAKRLDFHFDREFDAAVRSRRVRNVEFTSARGRYFYRKARGLL